MNLLVLEGDWPYGYLLDVTQGMREVGVVWILEGGVGYLMIVRYLGGDKVSTVPSSLHST